MSDDIRRLNRSRNERLITGLCGGIGVYFSVESVLIRAIFAALAFIGGGGVLLYIILAIVVPLEPEAELAVADDDGPPEEAEQ